MFKHYPRILQDGFEWPVYVKIGLHGPRIALLSEILPEDN